MSPVAEVAPPTTPSPPGPVGNVPQQASYLQGRIVKMLQDFGDLKKDTYVRVVEVRATNNGMIEERTTLVVDTLVENEADAQRFAGMLPYSAWPLAAPELAGVHVHM